MNDVTRGDPRIKPVIVKPDMQVHALTRQDIDQLHQATLTVLAETGVRFPSKKALDIFASAGAAVDVEHEIVKIPPEMLLASLDKVPKNITLGARGSKDLDAVLDGTKTYCGTAGTGITTVDYKTGVQRSSTKEDTAMMARVADYLPSIGFYWPMVAPRDTPPGVQALHELEASFHNTEKHVISASCVDTKTARSAAVDCRPAAGAIPSNVQYGVGRPLLSCPTAILWRWAAERWTRVSFIPRGCSRSRSNNAS